MVSAVYLGGTAAQQKQAVSDSLDQVYTLIKAGLETRKAKELAKVQYTYTTQSKLPALQAEIDRLSTNRDAASDAVSSLKSAHESAIKVLDHLNNASAAAKAGNTAAFDSAITQINILVGSRATDDSNLIGNSGSGQTGSKTFSLNAGTADMLVALQSLGTSYLLTDQNTGARMTPDFYTQTLTVGNGQKVALSQLSLVSRTDNSVTFTDGTSTWSADLQTGGLPLGSSFLYGGLTGDGQTRALSDINAAMKIVAKAVGTLGNTNLQAEVGIATLQGQLDTLGDQAQTLNTQESDAQAAALKAINTRYSLLESNIAFAAQAQREVIGAVIGEDQITSQSVFDIMGTSYSST
ncbi:hypothetical protein [Zavarzinia sp.]|uniref:hypothetical protein n=1 Tax=Zavarzinia sp. TaxID=2027920 RepID=UPI0035664A46